MLAFDKSNANLLKELLYRSYVHDAKLESIRYDSEDKCIKIALVICEIKYILFLRNLL